MARDYNKILQIPSPTDGSLKRFIVKLFEENSVSSIKVKIGILPQITIEGMKENNSEIEVDNTTENRSLQIVKQEIQSVLEGTSDTSVSINRIEFYGDVGQFCTFERVRTTPIQMVNSNRSSIEYHVAPDYRVAEFYMDRNNATEANSFNAALSDFLRPATGEDSGEGGPDGLNAVLSRMTAVTSGMMEDLAKSQLAQEKRMTALIEKQTEKLEEQKAKLDATHQENVEALNERSKELDKREAEMDNATTRSTRRKLRGAITDALKENQKEEIIPESARKVRTPILWLAGIGIMVPLLFSG